MKKHTKRLQYGFSLIELMVALAIAIILMGVAMPSFALWMTNTRIKSTAESMLSGIQLARAEAVRKNVRTRFQLTDGDGHTGWAVVSDSMSNPGTFPVVNNVQSVASEEYGGSAMMGVSTIKASSVNCCTTPVSVGSGAGSTPRPGLVFSSFGRVVTDSSATKIQRIDISSPDNKDAKRLVILISGSGMAKMCDATPGASTYSACK